MGSILLPGAYSLHIQASDADGELFTEVRLLKNGAAINTWTPNSTNPDITTDLAFNNAEYYYIIVKQSDGNEAISSPIWISDGNLVPVVSITSPNANDVFPAPANILIAARKKLAIIPISVVFRPRLTAFLSLRGLAFNST